MKELIAINGIKLAIESIKIANGYQTDLGSNVALHRIYENDVNNFPATAVAPLDSDSVNNQVGPSSSTEYNLNATIAVESLLEVDPDTIEPIYNAWRDITKAVLSWTATPPNKITVRYDGKTITYPDESNRIAVLQVRFTIQYIEDLTS